MPVARKVRNGENPGDDQLSPSHGGAGSVQDHKSSSSPSSPSSSLSSPRLSPSSPGGGKEVSHKVHQFDRHTMDYEVFRREKNKQAARDFRDRQKKTLQDLNTRVRALETERNALTARLLHRESEAKLYEQQIADYRDLLLLYSAKYGIDGVITSPSVQIPPLAPPQQPQQVGFNGTDVQSLQNV